MSLRTRLSRLGADPICSGDVWIVVDEKLTMTHTPTAIEGTHRVLVIGNPALLQDDTITTATVIPCTTNPIFSDGSREVAIPPGTSGFAREAYAITYLVQAVRKDDLRERTGTVDDRVLDRVKGAIVDVLDLV